MSERISGTDRGRVSVVRTRTGPVPVVGRPVDPSIGPTATIWHSGDRLLNTPSLFNGGVFDGPTAEGVGSSEFFHDRDSFGRAWGTRSFAWPAFGGTETGEGIDWVSNDVGFNDQIHRSVALLGRFEIAGVADYGISFVASAALVPTGLYAEVHPYLGGSSVTGTNLWGQGSVQATFVASIPGSLDIRDRVSVFAKPGDMPEAVVVWTNNGALHAATISVGLDASLQGTSAAQHLRTSLSPAVALGPSIGFTAASLELDGHGTDDRILLAWVQADGVHVGTIDLTTDLSLTEVATISGTFLSVDVGYIDDDNYAVIAGASTGGTVAIINATSGVVASTTVSGTRAGVRGSTVDSRPLVLSRDATGWDLWIYTTDLTSFETFDAGTKANPADAPDIAAVLGHPDGRIVVYVRGRLDYSVVQATFDANSIGGESYDYASLDLYTYSDGVLTARDHMQEPNARELDDPTNTVPVRLLPLNDYWFGLSTVGYPGANGNLNWIGLIAWCGMPPNDWFGYIHDLTATRFAKTVVTTNYEEFGPYLYDPVQLRYELHNPPLDICLFDIDDTGAVVAVGDVVQVATEVGNVSPFAVSEGDRLWVVYDANLTPEESGGEDRERVATFAIGEDLTLTPIADVEIGGDGMAPVARGAYMGDGIIVWPDLSLVGVNLVRVDTDGNATPGTPLSYTEIGMTTLGAVFNETSPGTLRRVGETDIVVFTGVHQSDGLSGRSQVGVATLRVNRETLTLEPVDITSRWQQADPTARCEFLGWTFGGNGAMWQFSPDGSTLAVLLPILLPTPTIMVSQPWSSNTPGGQGWYPEAVDEEVMAWVNIDDNGLISVDYERVNFAWKGVTVGSRSASRLIDDGGSSNPRYHIAQTMMTLSSETAVVVTVVPHDDTAGNPDLWMAPFEMFYALSFRRGTELTSIRPLDVSDGGWHTGVVPALESSGLFHWDGYPLPFSRCDLGTFDSDAWAMKMRVIGGVGASRGTGEVVNQDMAVYRSAKNTTPTLQ